MEVDGLKIFALMAHYGKSKGYAEKSYVSTFCEDFDLNYKQWSAYTRGAQNMGMKIIDRLIEIFPKLNLNWLLKDDGYMFNDFDMPLIVAEPGTPYGQSAFEKEVLSKLNAMHQDIKHMKDNYRLSQN